MKHELKIMRENLEINGKLVIFSIVMLDYVLESLLATHCQLNSVKLLVEVHNT